MPIREIDGLETLRAELGDDGVAYLCFFGAFSERSRRQRPVFDRLARSHPDARLFLVDVGRVKDVHRHYGVTAVPAVAKVRGDKLVQLLAGERPLSEYEALLTATPLAAAKGDESGRAHRVTVYTTQTCPWCVRVKDYLRRHQVRFQEVDVSRDPEAARRLTARTGQMGVPQTDVDGRFVVGFDKPKLDALLGLARS